MFIAYGDSRVGLARKINEDSISDCTGPFFILADGMGGYLGGKIASNLAVESAENYLKEIPLSDISEEILKESILYANQMILERKSEDQELSSMGTTMISAVIRDGCLSWAHVGDSRLYIYVNQKLQQLTTDHSFVMELLAKGKITEEEMLVHPRKNEITRAVGVKKRVQVDTGTILLENGTLVLLCTDGLTGMVSEETISKILGNYKNQTKDALSDCGEQLFRKTYDKGAKDNVSLILIDYWSRKAENTNDR